MLVYLSRSSFTKHPILRQDWLKNVIKYLYHFFKSDSLQGGFSIKNHGACQVRLYHNGRAATHLKYFHRGENLLVVTSTGYTLNPFIHTNIHSYCRKKKSHTQTKASAHTHCSMNIWHANSHAPLHGSWNHHRKKSLCSTEYHCTSLTNINQFPYIVRMDMCGMYQFHYLNQFFGNYCLQQRCAVACHFRLMGWNTVKIEVDESHQNTYGEAQKKHYIHQTVP